MAQGKANSLFEQGMTHFHNKDYEKAITYFEESIMENPENFEALYNLACSYAQVDDTDNAVIYFDRAAKLNPECIQWAKEDPEFDQMRENSVFQNILRSYDIHASSEEQEETGNKEDEEFKEFQPEKIQTEEAPASSYQEPKEEPPPPLDDGQTSGFSPTVEESDLPPCAHCGGIVYVEKHPRYNLLLSLGIVLAGMCISTTMFISFLGFLGIPIISLGLYLFTQMKYVWACQNCGATEAQCGQPPDWTPPKPEPVK